jgi:glycosyltransferase involved in cell wall biosynthesis
LIVPCLESVLNQTYEDFDVLIYNDGSVDNTRFMIEKFNDPRIKYYHSDINRGVSYARNRLLEYCKTNIACWVDSDDLINKYRIQIQLKVLNENSGCYVACNSVIFTDPKEIDINEYKIDNKHYEYPFAGIMFYTKNVPMFDETLQFSEDIEWRLRLPYKEKRINNVLYYIRFHPNRLGVEKRQ